MIDRVDRNVQRLLHMLKGIKRLNEMLDGVAREEFLDDLRLQDASAFDISTIGEAAANVTEEFKNAHPRSLGFRCVDFETDWFIFLTMSRLIMT